MALLTISENEPQLAVAAADRVTTAVRASIEARGSAVLCLTGGSTPRELYRLLGDPAASWASRIDWTRVHLFWGDERHVPPDHRDSNFGMAHPLLIARVPIPPGQVHRMRGELPAAGAAAAYEETLRTGFAAAGRRDQTFDLMLLGIGEDAHIASIFPGSPLLQPHEGGPVAPHGSFRGERAAAVWAAHLDAWRITLTPAALLDARLILMLAAGAAKRDALRAALQLPEDRERWPAQLLRDADDRIEWMVDRAAAP